VGTYCKHKLTVTKLTALQTQQCTDSLYFIKYSSSKKMFQPKCVNFNFVCNVYHVIIFVRRTLQDNRWRSIWFGVTSDRHGLEFKIDLQIYCQLRCPLYKESTPTHSFHSLSRYYCYHKHRHHHLHHHYFLLTLKILPVRQIPGSMIQKSRSTMLRRHFYFKFMKRFSLHKFLQQV
jgi:hypothetical protein